MDEGLPEKGSLFLLIKVTYMIGMKFISYTKTNIRYFCFSKIFFGCLIVWQ